MSLSVNQSSNQLVARSNPGNGKVVSWNNSGHDAHTFYKLPQKIIDVPWDDGLLRSPAATLLASIFFAWSFLENVHSNPGSLINNLFSPTYVRLAMDVASKWSGETHIDVEDLRERKLFEGQWQLQGERLIRVPVADVEKMISQYSSIDRPCAVTMTRNSVHIAYCTLPMAGGAYLHVIFDPQHSSDARMFLSTEISQVAMYIQAAFNLDVHVDDGSLVELLGQLYIQEYERRQMDPARAVHSAMVLKLQALPMKGDSGASKSENPNQTQKISEMRNRLMDLTSRWEDRHQELETLRTDNARLAAERDDAKRMLMEGARSMPPPPPKDWEFNSNLREKLVDFVRQRAGGFGREVDHGAQQIQPPGSPCASTSGSEPDDDDNQGPEREKQEQPERGRQPNWVNGRYPSLKASQQEKSREAVNRARWECTKRHMMARTEVTMRRTNGELGWQFS